MGYGIGTAANRPVRPVTPRAPVQPRPDNRAGPFGASPAFPTLASPARPRPAAAPAAPTYTNDQVTQSLARNPQAAGSNGSLFAYQGQPQIAAAVSPAINPAPVAPVAPNVSYDYNADPILAQTKALSAKNRGDATSSALAARKQLAIDYNDTALADSLGDPATSAAAGANPFGVLKQLERSYNTGAHNLDEDLNNQNGFYSSYRTQQQGNLAHNYQGQLAGAAGQEQGLLGGIGDQLTAALSAADAADIAAQQQAAAAAAAAAAANGVDPGAAAGAGVQPGAPQAPPAGDALAGPATDPVAAALASMIFPTPNTELINPAAFPAADALAGPSAQPDPLAAALGSSAMQTAAGRAANGYEGPIGGPMQAVQSALEVPSPAPVANPLAAPADSIASLLFPTAGTPYIDPAAFAAPAAAPPPPPAAAVDPYAGLTPAQRRRLIEGL